MKILFCTSALITGRGGIASYAHDFITAFRDSNNFTVVTNDGYRKKESDCFEAVHFAMNDFSLSNARRFMTFIAEINPQLIINSAFPLLSLVTPYLNDGIKIINVAHFVSGKLLMVAGLNANYADTIIAQSTYARENLRRLYKVKRDTRVEVVYNFMPSLPYVDLDRKKSRKTLKIVYPGGNSIAKSTDIVCMALKKLMQTDLDFEFYWIGRTKLPGANWPIVKTKEIGDCLNRHDHRIKVIAPIPREMAKCIMADANIFLLPSRGEGCPITLLEAMRGGCIPIISNAKHGSLDIIDNEKNGFVVEQNSVRQIVERITDIIKHPHAYDYIYDASLLKFKNDLQYNIWIDTMCNIMEKCSKHRKRVAFNTYRYIGDAVYIKIRYLLFWMQARFLFQPYCMLAFRYIKHFYK